MPTLTFIDRDGQPLAVGSEVRVAAVAGDTGTIEQLVDASEGPAKAVVVFGDGEREEYFAAFATRDDESHADDAALVATVNDLQVA